MTSSGIALTYPAQTRGVLGRGTDVQRPYRDPEALSGAREENRTPAYASMVRENEMPCNA